MATGDTGGFGDETLGIPGALQNQGMRKGLLAALMKLGDPAAASPAPTNRINDDPVSRANALSISPPAAPMNENLGLPGGLRMPSRMPVATPQMPTGVPPSSFGSPGLPNLPEPSTGVQTPAAQPSQRQSLIDQLLARYNELNQPATPPSVRQRLLHAVLQAAPLIAGGIGGGAAGLTGAARGENAATQEQIGQQNVRQAARQGESGRLLQEIGALDRTQESEDAATKRMTLQEQMMGEREKAAQDAQGRLFSQQQQLANQREDAAEQRLQEQIANRQQKPDSIEQQYVDEYQKLHPKSTLAQAVAAYAASTQKPERAPAITVVVPQPGGGGKVERLGVGSTISPGTTTPAGFNSESVADNKAAEATKKAQADAQSEYRLAQNFAAHPSPTNDLALVMRYIGATKPDSLGKLRLNQNEIKLVFGTRSTLGDVEALVSRVKNGQSLTPQQRQDMLGTMQILANSKGDGEQGGGGGAVQHWGRDASGKLVPQSQ